MDITELPERETHSGYGGYSLSQGDMDNDGVIGECERETHSGYGGYSLSQGDMDNDGVIGKC